MIFSKPRTDHAIVPFSSVIGLGLIEVMISAFIICIAMIGVSRLHNTQVQTAHHQERRLAAIALLDDKLADLRLIAHSGGMSSSDSLSDVIGNDRGGVLRAGEIRYDQYTFQLHWVVFPLPEPELKLLTVTVSWRDGQGKLQSVSGSTVFFVSSLSSAS